LWVKFEINDGTISDYWSDDVNEEENKLKKCGWKCMIALRSEIQKGQERFCFWPKEH
jgi:hypothetical protein